MIFQSLLKFLTMPCLGLVTSRYPKAYPLLYTVTWSRHAWYGFVCRNTAYNHDQEKAEGKRKIDSLVAANFSRIMWKHEKQATVKNGPEDLGGSLGESRIKTSWSPVLQSRTEIIAPVITWCGNVIYCKLDYTLTSHPQRSQSTFLYLNTYCLAV